MADTPFFPAWSNRLNPLGARTTKSVQQVRAYTLNQLETCFGPWLPEDLFPKAPDKANSRDHLYTRWRTFWCALWHNLNPGASCREVVRQLQALLRLEGGPVISEEDGGYCRGRARLPLGEFHKAVQASARTADRLTSGTHFLQGRRVKVADGSTVTLQDTPKNRADYPPVRAGTTPTFPQLKMVVLFSLLSGAILAAAPGALSTSELSLLHSLASHLVAGDILLGDRGFGNYSVIAWLQGRGVDFLGRTTRRVDGRRRLRRLGRNDWLLQWKQTPSCAAPWLDLLQRITLPGQITLCAVKGSCFQKGFRVRQITVVTTLLDVERYPAQEILQAYLRRWRLEMCLDDLKTTLQMDFLRNRSPGMVQQELCTRLIVHNLIRCLMAQAASKHGVALEHLSFKGSLDALRQFAQGMAQARSKAKRRELWAELLRTLASDLVPERPGRREPRAVKRKKNKYPRLRTSRRRFRERPKRNTRLKYARLRKLGLM